MTERKDTARKRDNTCRVGMFDRSSVCRVPKHRPDPARKRIEALCNELDARAGAEISICRKELFDFKQHSQISLLCDERVTSIA